MFAMLNGLFIHSSVMDSALYIIRSHVKVDICVKSIFVFSAEPRDAKQ